ncbi:MAG: hypothetical protein QW560_05955 [Candidatus Nitrosocaldus sp.]
MKIRVRGNGDRLRCWHCGSQIADYAVSISGDFYCIFCAVETFVEKIEALERRIEELEINNGITVRV